MTIEAGTQITADYNLYGIFSNNEEKTNLCMACDGPCKAQQLSTEDVEQPRTHGPEMVEGA